MILVSIKMFMFVCVCVGAVWDFLKNGVLLGAVWHAPALFSHHSMVLMSFYIHFKFAANTFELFSLHRTIFVLFLFSFIFSLTRKCSSSLSFAEQIAAGETIARRRIQRNLQTSTRCSSTYDRLIARPSGKSNGFNHLSIFYFFGVVCRRR